MLFSTLLFQDTTSRIHPFIFLWTPYGLISLQNACWIFSNLYIPPCVRKFFWFISFTFLENALNLCTFLHAPVPHSKLQVEVFGNLFPPKWKGWRKLLCAIKIQSENMKTTWNISMICNFSEYDRFIVWWIISIK